jgi:hypothetical protein
MPLAPGLISTAQGEYSATFDVARQTLVFMRRTPGLFDYALMESRFEQGAWTEPTVLPFSGEFRDAAPMFSPDGDWLYYDSKRPIDGFAPDSINLWRVARSGDGWAAPEPLKAASENRPGTAKSQVDEFGPVLDAQGTLWFYSFRPPFRGGAHYRSPGPDHLTVEQDKTLPDPSAETFVSYLSLSSDGRTAVLEGRSTTAGRTDSDLFYACMDGNGVWSDAIPLEAVNTKFGDGGGALTADGEILLLTSSRPVQGLPAGSANLFYVSTQGLPIPCKG